MANLDERQQQSRAHRVKTALARAQTYIAAGKIADVKRVLAERNISQSTLRNWLKSHEKAVGAYKWGEFVNAMDKLPDLEREKRNDAYMFALAELGIGRETQQELTSYSGNYKIFHDFPAIKLDHLAIRVEENPFVATFVFKYRNKEDRRCTCDGLIITRHGRIVFAGFSRTTIFQAVFVSAAYPERELIRGMAFIEDLNTYEIYFSRVAIARSSLSLNGTMRSNAEDHVRGSCFPL
jgi:hypothetical protein